MKVPRSRVLDPDRGIGTTQAHKKGLILGQDAADERAADRAGARQLDNTVEHQPGLSRQQKDRERAMPRENLDKLGDPRMQRTLQEATELRRPLSSRQRKARSKTKRAIQDRQPRTQYEAVNSLITDQQHWNNLNTALSDATGDAQMLPDRQRQQAQRVDRAIQAYEQANDRGHVVYCNLELPSAVNRGNVAGFLNNQLEPGTSVDIDRFTFAAHTMHEVEAPDTPARPIPMLEIQTRRGLYLGRSDGSDDTTHLLPRGMRLTVIGHHHATFQRPDGTLGTRRVIQLIDTTPTT